MISLLRKINKKPFPECCPEIMDFYLVSSQLSQSCNSHGNRQKSREKCKGHRYLNEGASIHYTTIKYFRL